ncbi:MAG: iron ABC transporter permease [Gammaproteobacteria bacterium]|nr:iron ABC transporter permease [Gammaproteobacteria bacterium]
MVNLLRLSRWQWLSTSIALLLALPVLVIVASLFMPASPTWDHLVETVLSEYISNSLILATGVMVGTLLIGTSTAWLTTMCHFPGRKIFEWALLLPLAMPAYIIAYTYTGIFDFAGPIQTTLREWTGWGYGDYWFPELRSIGGAITMLSLVLYPYVYLLARAAFLEQSVTVLEVSRSLGDGPWRGFRRIALPLARPAIIAGVSLVLMETLADYGTVQYFGVSTFTTGIFRTWFGLGDATSASQLAALLLSFLFILLIVEKFSRRKARYHHTSASAYRPLSAYKLLGWKRWSAMLLCLIPLLLGFIVPATQLGYWALETWQEMVNEEFYRLVSNSLLLAATTALLALIIALLLAYGLRIQRQPLSTAAVRIAGLGYAIPGTVIAIGVIIPFAWLDNTLDGWMRSQFDISTGLILSGTLVALIFGYLVRFLSVSLQTVESGLSKIRPNMDEAARSLGANSRTILFKIHLPMMRGTLLTALLLVFVDVMKELPATLVLRPFNFNTLAVRAFELASDERLADSSTAALMIIAAGLIPVLLLSFSITHSRRQVN